MTVKEALEIGAKKLGAAHTHDPQGCAKFLLRHILSENPDDLAITGPEKRLTTSQETKYRDALLRRKLHEPVWYITNEAFFWRDVFYVDERVLIPRPETELLVETVLGYLSDDKDQPCQDWPLSIVDLGTGSGVVAISLYQELMTRSVPVHMSASDISPAAIEVAKLNAKRLGVEHSIEFLVGDALGPLEQPADIIVGNPPYIPTETVGGLAYDIHHFEPRVALDGGKDGLEVHRKILSQAKRKLKRRGVIFLEIGHDQGKIASKLAQKYYPRADVEIKKDYSDIDRILIIKS